MPPTRVRLGVFDLDLRAGELRAFDRTTRLQQQPLQILLMLMERPGEIVTRDEMQKKLWPNDTVVEFDHSINAAIKNLRRALADSADEPRYVETVARRGYRLLMPVVRLRAAQDDDSAPLPSLPSAQAGRAEPPNSSQDIELHTPAGPGGLIGKKVSHYRVLEVIGAGGMGLVFKAEDLKLGRQVALKFLPEELAWEPAALQRFEREAQAASSLDHPNICTIYEVEEHEEQPFIVMQLLEGETLRDRLVRVPTEQKALPLDELLAIAIQIASGLCAAHDKGIIHRDIKPANIFLSTSGQAKILDFGVAKLVEAPNLIPANGEENERRLQPRPGLNPNSHNDQQQWAEARLFNPSTPALEATLTRTGAMLGTAGYMSPEQVSGDKLDARTDLFSLGLVLYEMATGQRAFSGETQAVLHDAILHTAAVPVHDLNSTLPPKLEKIIAKALEKDPERRYQSAAAMQAALKEVDVGRRVSLHRRWKLMVRAAVIMTAIALVAGVLYWRRHNTPKLTENDTVVLAGFANHTSDPVFDTALNPALATELSQTAFLTILSPAKARETLKLLGHPENTRMTAQLSHEVCERTNSKATIEGSISDDGNHYQIEIKAVDCKTGNTLADSAATVADRNEIVNKLGEAGARLREELGEPPSSVRKFNAPLDQATSASPEALQALAAGSELYGKPEAVGYYERATELDPNFALAFRHLGMAYANLDETDLASENITKAFQLRQRLSRRDRFDIERRYYQFITGEYDKAISVMQQQIQEFPEQGGPRIPLAVLWHSIGQYEKAAAAARDGIRLAPDQMVPYDVLEDSYAALDRLDEAKVVLEQAKAQVPDQWQLHWDLYYLAFLERNQAGMQEQVRWAANNPGLQDFILAEESGAQAYYGRLRKADELSRQAAESAERSGAPERVAEWKAMEALWAAKVGKTTQAVDLAQQAEPLNVKEEYRAIVAMAFATAGDVTRALQVADQLDRQDPVNTLVQGAYLPTIRAEVEIQRGNPASAIALLERAAPYDLMSSDYFGLEPAYVRGEAYLKAGQGQQAAAEFRKVLEHPGIDGFSINGPLARLQLGRAQVMMGDNVAARRSYQDFLTLWKDADLDIPIYKQAKAEYAKLQ